MSRETRKSAAEKRIEKEKAAHKKAMQICRDGKRPET